MEPAYTYFSDLAEEMASVPTESIVSRTIYKDERFSVVLFGFATGQELSEHTASVPATIHILQGDCTLTLGPDKLEASAGAWARMPANLPHSVLAKTPVVMLLMMFREAEMKILTIITGGEYGQRHLANIRQHAPAHWQIDAWQAPSAYPLVIDYPEDYLPESLPAADLLLSFAEHKGVAELLPDIARLTGAQAVIASVDSEAWLPRGLARQLRGWLEDIGVACATPKPLCSLTGKDYLVTRRQRQSYDDPRIAEFARYFGQPELRLELDPQTRTIRSAEVIRDAVCGCARHVAEALIGVSADEAEEKAGLAHHHFPCLASMGIDPDFNDTLMHVSGNIMRDEVLEQVKPYKQTRRITPGKRSEEGP